MGNNSVGILIICFLLSSYCHAARDGAHAAAKYYTIACLIVSTQNELCLLLEQQTTRGKVKVNSKKLGSVKFSVRGKPAYWDGLWGEATKVIYGESFRSCFGSFCRLTDTSRIESSRVATGGNVEPLWNEHCMITWVGGIDKRRMHKKSLETIYTFKK